GTSRGCAPANRTLISSRSAWRTDSAGGAQLLIKALPFLITMVIRTDLLTRDGLRPDALKPPCGFLRDHIHRLRIERRDPFAEAPVPIPLREVRAKHSLRE